MRSESSNFKASEIRRPVQAIRESKVEYVIGRIDPLGVSCEAARKRRPTSSGVRMQQVRRCLGARPKMPDGGT